MTAPTHIETATTAEPVMTYVIEEQVDHGNWEVRAVRLSLAAAFVLGEQIVGNHPTYGSPREWKIDWRESTDASGLRGDDAILRTWSGHRPRRPEPTMKFIGHEYRPETWSETYVGVSITEHPVPAEEQA